MSTFAVLLALVTLGLFWVDCMRARETATEACRRTCVAYQVQLLDATVALRSLSLLRAAGGLRVKRRYRFVFSTTGNDRQEGEVVMVGRSVQTVYLSPT